MWPTPDPLLFLFRGPQEKPGNLEEKGAGEFQDFEGSLDREAPRDRLYVAVAIGKAARAQANVSCSDPRVVTGSQEQRAQQERMGPRVRTVMWDLPAPTDHQYVGMANSYAQLMFQNTILDIGTSWTRRPSRTKGHGCKGESLP